MEVELLNFFGSLIKESRDSGLHPLEYFEKTEPKNPDESLQALLKLLKSLDSENKELLKKTVKYCVESSLFKLINRLENGLSLDCSFELIMKKGNEKLILINNEVDNDLIHEFWGWVE